MSYPSHVHRIPTPASHSTVLPAATPNSRVESLVTSDVSSAPSGTPKRRNRTRVIDSSSGSSCDSTGNGNSPIISNRYFIIATLVVLSNSCVAACTIAQARFATLLMIFCRTASRSTLREFLAATQQPAPHFPALLFLFAISSYPLPAPKNLGALTCAPSKFYFVTL